MLLRIIILIMLCCYHQNYSMNYLLGYFSKQTAGQPNTKYKLLKTIPVKIVYDDSIAIDQESQQVVVGETNWSHNSPVDNAIKIWDHKGDPVATIKEGLTVNMFGVDVSKDHIAAYLVNDKVIIYDKETQKEVLCIDHDIKNIDRIKFNPVTNHILVWDLSLDTNQVIMKAFDMKGDLLFASQMPYDVRQMSKPLIDPNTGNIIHSYFEVTDNQYGNLNRQILITDELGSTQAAFDTHVFSLGNASKLDNENNIVVSAAGSIVYPPRRKEPKLLHQRGFYTFKHDGTPLKFMKSPLSYNAPVFDKQGNIIYTNDQSSDQETIEVMDPTGNIIDCVNYPEKLSGNQLRMIKKSEELVLSNDDGFSLFTRQ